jgi:hypothetical protein
MNEAVANLSRTDGVLGVSVFDEAGTCVANDLPPPYEPILMLEVLRRLAAAFDVFASIEANPANSFAMDCDEGSLVIRKVESNWVVALTEPNVNMNMLNVAMNVVALNLGRTGPKSGPQSIGRASIDGVPSRASVLHSSATAALEIPPDAVERSLVQQLLVVYKDYLGPAAKPVMKQQLAGLGVTSHTLRKIQFSDLVTRLASKIPVAQRQQEFLNAVADLRRRALS